MRAPGNDLARVLNWGGSLCATLAGCGLQELLQAVHHSTPAPFDRWDVRIQPTVRLPAPSLEP